jgi:hypothetical protein
MLRDDLKCVATLFAALACFAASSMPVLSETPPEKPQRRITGKVVGANNGGIERITVTVKPEGRGIIATDVTPKDGSYTLKFEAQPVTVTVVYGNLEYPSRSIVGLSGDSDQNITKVLTKTDEQLSQADAEEIVTTYGYLAANSSAYSNYIATALAAFPERSLPQKLRARFSESAQVLARVKREPGNFLSPTLASAKVFLKGFGYKGQGAPMAVSLAKGDGTVIATQPEHTLFIASTGPISEPVPLFLNGQPAKSDLSACTLKLSVHLGASSLDPETWEFKPVLTLKWSDGTITENTLERADFDSPAGTFAYKVAGCPERRRDR